MNDAIDRQPRDAPSRGRAAATARSRSRSASRSASSPSPVVADTGTIGAPLEKRSRDQLARPPCRASSSVSASTRSALVSATTPAGTPQQPADVEVLARLRHHRLVGGDDQHDAVDAADAGEHVLHEALVAGHVDERER